MLDKGNETLYDLVWMEKVVQRRADYLTFPWLSA